MIVKEVQKQLDWVIEMLKKYQQREVCVRSVDCECDICIRREGLNCDETVCCVRSLDCECDICIGRVCFNPNSSLTGRHNCALVEDKVFDEIPQRDEPALPFHCASDEALPVPLVGPDHLVPSGIEPVTFSESLFVESEELPGATTLTSRIKSDLASEQVRETQVFADMSGRYKYAYSFDLGSTCRYAESESDILIMDRITLIHKIKCLQLPFDPGVYVTHDVAIFPFEMGKDIRSVTHIGYPCISADRAIWVVSLSALEKYIDAYDFLQYLYFCDFNLSWQPYTTVASSHGDNSSTVLGLLEQLNVIREVHIYLWYKSNVEIDLTDGGSWSGNWSGLIVLSAGQVLHMFVKNRCVRTMVYGLYFTFDPGGHFEKGANTIPQIPRLVKPLFLHITCALIVETTHPIYKFLVRGLPVVVKAGDDLFGSIDTWLTGSLIDGVDVSNMSRTMLLNITPFDMLDCMEPIAADFVSRLDKYASSKVDQFHHVVFEESDGANQHVVGLREQWSAAPEMIGLENQAVGLHSKKMQHINILHQHTCIFTGYMSLFFPIPSWSPTYRSKLSSKDVRLIFLLVEKLALHFLHKQLDNFCWSMLSINEEECCLLAMKLSNLIATTPETRGLRYQIQFDPGRSFLKKCFYLGDSYQQKVDLPVEITIKEWSKAFGWNRYYPFSLLQDITRDNQLLRAQLGEHFLKFPFDPGSNVLTSISSNPLLGVYYDNKEMNYAVKLFKKVPHKILVFCEMVISCYTRGLWCHDSVSVFSDYSGDIQTNNSEIEKIRQKLEEKWFEHSVKFVDSEFEYYYLAASRKAWHVMENKWHSYWVKFEDSASWCHCNSCLAGCSRVRCHSQTHEAFDLCSKCFISDKFEIGMIPSDFIFVEIVEEELMKVEFSEFPYDPGGSLSRAYYCLIAYDNFHSSTATTPLLSFNKVLELIIAEESYLCKAKSRSCVAGGIVPKEQRLQIEEAAHNFQRTETIDDIYIYIAFLRLLLVGFTYILVGNKFPFDPGGINVPFVGLSHQFPFDPGGFLFMSTP